jgi:hypothetical protein
MASDFAFLTQDQVAAQAEEEDYGGNSFFEGIGERAAGVGRATLQGVTWGWGDEAIAKIRSLLGDQDYHELLKLERKALDKYRKENPKTALALELGAGFYIPGGLFGGMAKGSIAGAKGMAKMSGAGAVHGGAYGAGAAEEGERLEGAKMGATIGAVAGPVLQKTVGAGANYLGRRLRPDDVGLFDLSGRYQKGKMAQADYTAANKVQRAYAEDLAETDPAALAQLQREGLPATEHMRGVTERPGQSQRMLADTEGGRITELGMGATTSSKRAVESAERAFGARMGEEFDEVSTLLASTMRSTTKGTEMANEAADNAAQVASKWYNKAYGAGPNPSGAGPSVVPRFIDLDPFRSFLSNRHFERAYKKLEDDINTKIQTRKLPEGARWPTHEQFMEIERVPVQMLHKIKQELDTYAGWGSRESSVAKNLEGVRDVISAVNSQISKQNPEYAQANKIFSAGLRLQESVARGAASKNMNPSKLKREYKGLETEWERAGFRAGLVEEILKSYNANTSKNFAAFFKNNKSMQDRLRATFKSDVDGEKAMRQYVASLEERLRYRTTAKKMLGSSQSLERQGAKEGLRSGASKMADVGIQATQMNVTNALRAMASGLDNKVVADRIGKLLFTSSKKELDSALDLILRSHKSLSGMDRARLWQLRKGNERRSAGAAGVVGGLLSDPERSGQSFGLLE